MTNTRTIYHYIDAAMKAQGFELERHLAAKLDVAQSGISAWKLGKTNIPDEKIILLAELGELDPHLAVIDAAIWRAKGAKYSKVLIETADIIAAAA